MKLGVLQFFSWPERRVDLATVYGRALERVEIMDQTGYDAVWLAEHHFSSFSVCPSVHMVGTLAAARTKRLRIGTAVSLAPFYHPLRLAEEVALLDLLSGGRVNWGAGRGFARVEFTAFGVPPEESATRSPEAGTAAEVARGGAEWILNSYLGAQQRPVMQGSFTPAGVDPVRRYLNEVILHGTADKVLDDILQLREEIGLDYLLCAPLSHQSFMLLTEKVLPRLP